MVTVAMPPGAKLMIISAHFRPCTWGRDKTTNACKHKETIDDNRCMQKKIDLWTDWARRDGVPVCIGLDANTQLEASMLPSIPADCFIPANLDTSDS